QLDPYRCPVGAFHQMRIDEDGRGQGVVHHALSLTEDLCVEVRVEGEELRRALGPFTRNSRQLRQPLSRGDRAHRHVQRDQIQGETGLEHHLGGLGVVGDIGLGVRPHVPGITYRTTHDHQTTHQVRQAWFQGKGQRQVGERTHRQNIQLTWVLPGQTHQQLRRGLLTRFAGRRGQLHTAQAVHPVYVWGQAWWLHQGSRSPHATGTSGRPYNSRRRRALSVVTSTPLSPNTAPTPAISTSERADKYASATASSIPGSQSTNTRLVKEPPKK